MSLDDHKQMSRRAIGMWTSNNSDRPEDIFAENYVNHQEPDVEGDQVATRWESTATHTGDFIGAAPTGKQVTWTGVQIDRFEDGKIVESWVDWDKYRFLEGLGLVK